MNHHSFNRLSADVAYGIARGNALIATAFSRQMACGDGVAA
jgi:hypothetical protein